MTPIEKIMRTAPVIPVLVIEDAAHARGIAKALVAGGLPVLEVTLRTAAALDAIAPVDAWGTAERCRLQKLMMQNHTPVASADHAPGDVDEPRHRAFTLW